MGSNLFIAVLSQEVDGIPGEAHGLPFEEGDVEAGGVVVDELEEEHLQGEAVLIVRLGPRQLCGWRQVRDGGQRRRSEPRSDPTPPTALTEVGDPDGDALVEDVEDHDDNEADDRSRDRGGHLGRHVLLQRLQLLQVLRSEPRGEGEEGGQAVDGDGDDGRHDEQNLKDKKQERDKNLLETVGKFQCWIDVDESKVC